MQARLRPTNVIERRAAKPLQREVGSHQASSPHNTDRKQCRRQRGHHLSSMQPPISSHGDPLMCRRSLTSFQKHQGFSKPSRPEDSRRLNAEATSAARHIARASKFPAAGSQKPPAPRILVASEGYNLLASCLSKGRPARSMQIKRPGPANDIQRESMFFLPKI